MRPGNVAYNLLPARRPDPEDPVGLGADFTVLSESLAVTGGPNDWTVELSLTSADATITIAEIAGGYDLSKTPYTGGAGITIAVMSIEIDLADNPGLCFIGAGAAGQLSVLLKEYGGLAKDGDGIYIALADNPGLYFVGAGAAVLLKEYGGLAKDGDGIYIASQDASLGSTVPTDISGENLAWGASSGNYVFDPKGLYNPSGSNTLIHTTPGVHAYYSPPGNVYDVATSYDANGHATGFCLWNNETWAWSSPWGTARPANPPSNTWDS
jgi:hypothetical protein